MSYTATYSPEDNKLRLYASSRLDPETYEKVKAAGFRWAPKQELFVAPSWTPSREDLLVELAGEVGDEDTSLVERAEAKAERLEALSERRVGEARSTRAAVDRLADGIPFGQPILVGHHSEKRARKDAEKIRNGMDKTVSLFKQAQYWVDRAEGAVRLAKYKELPGVRARRIKTLGAEMRKIERSKADSARKFAAWTKVQAETDPEKQKQMAIYVANHCWLTLPKKEGDSERMNDGPTAHGALTNDFATLYVPRTVEEVAAYAVKAYTVPVGGKTDRWIEHYQNRIAYETAMLAEQGASELLAPKPRRKLPPLLNYRAEGGSITTENPWNRGETITYPQVDMTKAEYAKVYTTFTRLGPNKAHRIRLAVMKGQKVVTVFLTDQKEHPPQTAISLDQESPKPPAKPIVNQPNLSTPGSMDETMAQSRAICAAVRKPDTITEELKAARERAKTGVQVAVAPQLFPTPKDLAAKMASYAGIEDGDHVLEPSAGTGALMQAAAESCPGIVITAVEHHKRLAAELTRAWPDAFVLTRDFLELTGADIHQAFEVILMNPPFERGADIQHITHALKFLKPGGRLVAIVANGPRQRAAFMDHAEHWEDLPAGTFAEQGTQVRTALLVLRAPE